MSFSANADKQKRDILDILKISSAEGGSHIKSLFTTEDGVPVPIRYVDKEKTTAMLQTQGYLAAVGTQSDGFWDSITPIGEGIKPEELDDMAEIAEEAVKQADTDLEAVSYEGVEAQNSEYGAIREGLAKKGLDELSKRYRNYFPLSASFDKTIRSDHTPLVMETVVAKSVQRTRKDSPFKVGRKAFTSAYGTKTVVHIDQMDIDVELYADVANESISKSIGQHNEQSTLDAIPHIREILSNSILMGVERIVHTYNKGTALYGYRLYNLYWYNDGKTRTPHALACTVVQDLNKAEGYVFQNIENVAIGRGLPGTKAGMSSSVNGNTYTVAQLYDAVKKIDRGDGGLKYTDTERDKYLFSYTERNDGEKYSDHNTDSVSNRTLLANALEGTLQNEVEKKRLEEYRTISSWANIF